uniref:Variant surface glycoprotein n=1 Tax=Trypanosoma brucei TaxID=5691 RepID=A0A1V0FY22_9TRYP|nr:variant surface glycoprotein [Trypanosoma brucei]
MPARQKITAFFVASAIALEARAAKDSLKGSMTTEVCNFALSLRKAGPLALERLTRLEHAVSKLRQVETKLRKAAAAQDGAITEKHLHLALYVNKLRQEGQAAILSTAKKTAALGAHCDFQAGRITEFLAIFAQSTGSSKHCITNGQTTNKREAADIPCLKAASLPEAAEPPAADGQNTIPTSFRNLVAATGNSGTGAATSGCKLTGHDSTTNSYLDTEETTAEIKWGDGLYKTVSNAAVAATHWASNTGANLATSKYHACDTTLTQILAEGADAITAADNLEKILQKGAPGITEVTIEADRIYTKVPPKQSKISPEELAIIAGLIEALPKQTNSPGKSTDQLEGEQILVELQRNETACKIGREIQEEKACKVTQATSQKCGGKEQVRMRQHSGLRMERKHLQDYRKRTKRGSRKSNPRNNRDTFYLHREINKENERRILAGNRKVKLAKIQIFCKQ